MIRNLVAEKIYRDAWFCWLMTTSEVHRLCLQDVMDEQQCEIATGPKDPRWQAFIDDLPHFLEFWERFEKIR